MEFLVIHDNNGYCENAHCYVISTLSDLFRVRFEVFIVMTMKISVFWCATNVARLKNTDVSSYHSVFIMTCLLSTHTITP